MEWKNWHEDKDVEVKIGTSKKSIQGTPAVVAWSKGLLHVFVHGTDASIYHGIYTGNETAPKWTWEALAATQPAGGLAAIAATSWGNDRIDLFARGTDKKIYHLAWNGPYKWEAQWSALLVGSTDDAPAASSWGDGRLDVFVHTLDHHISNLNYANSAWSKEWLNVGGYGSILHGAPASAASGAKRVDLFASETSSRTHLLHSFYDGTGYTSAEKAGSQAMYVWANPDISKTSGATNDETHEISGFPAACSSPLGDGRVDVFVRSGARLIHREFKNDHWTNKWEDLGGTNTKRTIAGDPAAVAWYEGGWARYDCFAIGEDKNKNKVLKHISWP